MTNLRGVDSPEGVWIARQRAVILFKGECCRKGIGSQRKFQGCERLQNPFSLPSTTPSDKLSSVYKRLSKGRVRRHDVPRRNLRHYARAFSGQWPTYGSSSDPSF